MNVAFIPARGGSKSIPLKNIKEIAGKPLIYWTAKAANECSRIDRVFVATDSSRIRETVEGFGLKKVSVVDRSAYTADDTASTESAMLEFCNHYEFDNIVLIQATSPLLTSMDLERGFEIYHMGNCDSVISVVRQKRFLWNRNENGYVMPMNYDYRFRPRRQEFEGYLVENGAFYITKRQACLQNQNRLSGNILAYEMDETAYWELDEPGDWKIVEQLLYERTMTVKNIPPVKMFLTDCDGCLTDGGMYYSEKGDELKKFHTRDGMGFQLLREKGIITGIITGEDCSLNLKRAEKMHVDEIFQNVKDKLKVVKQLCGKYHIEPEYVAYVGDDINDLEVLKYVGYGCCVRDAGKALKKYADYIAKQDGGHGAVREIIDHILCTCK